MKTILLAILALSSLSGQAQTLNSQTADSLSKPVKSFIKQNPDMSAYQASCLGLNYCRSFSYKGKKYFNRDYIKHSKTYELSITQKELFSTLLNDHPKEIWNGDSKFQLLYRPSTQEVFGAKSQALKLELGDIVILELIIKMNMLQVKIPVAFKIIELDEKEGLLTFSYLTNNKSKGIQQLSLKGSSSGKISLTHTTRYLSGNSLRDKHIYQPFHVKMTDDFYRRLETHIKKKKK